MVMILQLSFSESDTSVACDLTELTPLVLTNDLQSTDMKDWQWSDQWFPPVAVPARESVREMAQNRIHVTKYKNPRTVYSMLLPAVTVI